MVCVKAIQIIAPDNHTLALQLEDFRYIFEADNIKDRHVSIVSIAGAFRKGKSFLLNFFLKYLYAQYKKHDVTDWIGEKGSNDEMDGFTSRGGRKPETAGIWMWSEIFTHDYDNGEKVAIILLDTQGLFDNQSTTKDCTATFAISMMLASVQCYNVMQNIQEDHLQHLELFTEYGRLAMQHTNEKPFQKLLFIIRDWQCDDEFEYGDGQAVIDEFLAEIDLQTTEMHSMRQRLKSSFEQIGAYLLPYPGKYVANGKLKTIFKWLGLQENKGIEPEFIDSLKGMVPLIFAPENLILKKINGVKIRAGDLLTYLPTYVDIFNDGPLPDPTSVLLSTAAADHMLLYNKCLNHYTKSMQNYLEVKSTDQNEPFFDPLEFQSHHEKTNNESMQQFDSKPKLGVEQLTVQFRNQLINDIGTKHEHFKQENDRAKNNFNTLAKEKMYILVVDCIKMCADSVKNAFGDVDSYFSESELQQISDDALNKSIAKFEMHPKIGNDELVDMFLEKLRDGAKIQLMLIEKENDKKRRFFEDLENKTEEAAVLAKLQARAEASEKAASTARADTHNITLYNKCMNEYKIAMDNALYRKSNDYYEPNDLQRIHEEAREKSLKSFREKFNDGGQEIMLETRLESEIETNYINFQHKNEWKRKEIQEAKEKADIREGKIRRSTGSM